MDHDAVDEHTDAAFVDRVRALLAEPGATDPELHDPPEDLWSRIATVIADDASASEPASPLAVEYRIDADDIVVGVADGWGRFASENGAAALDRAGSGRTIWSYFDGDDIVELWRLVVERVRQTDTSATVPLRCDSPTMRRWYEMTVTAEHGGSVRFRSVLQFEEPRDEVPLLDPTIERDETAAAVALCSWCAKGHDGSQWVDIEDLLRGRRLLEDALPAVSYGICPNCRDAMSAELLVADSSSTRAS